MRTHPYVTHKRDRAGQVYVGRPSRWGNPYSHHSDGLAPYVVSTREEAIRAYAQWIQTQPELLAVIPELRGRILVCWCAPQPCHAEVLSALANGTPMPECCR